LSLIVIKHGKVVQARGHRRMVRAEIPTGDFESLPGQDRSPVVLAGLVQLDYFLVECISLTLLRKSLGDGC
jgi:hypothetical protein